MDAASAVEILALRSNEHFPRGTWSRLEATRSQHPDVRVRSAALTVIAARGNHARVVAALEASAHDAAASIRRRVSELAEARRSSALVPVLLELLKDPDTQVAYAAAAALGECARTRATRDQAVPVLARTTTTHPDALVREASVAALGALGDARGLPAILSACTDKPAIRRRAVLALAPFSGPEVDAALAHARTDRDWQTRQAAELLHPE
ncbi:MAG: HEAT repeat domain-containing protein [Acidimicrobiia bacterium]